QRPQGELAADRRPGGAGDHVAAPDEEAERQDHRAPHEEDLGRGERRHQPLDRRVVQREEEVAGEGEGDAREDQPPLGRGRATRSPVDRPRRWLHDAAVYSNREREACGSASISRPMPGPTWRRTTPRGCASSRNEPRRSASTACGPASTSWWPATTTWPGCRPCSAWPTPRPSPPASGWPPGCSSCR